MYKSILSTFALVGLFTATFAQNVFIPDSVFKARLTQNAALNTNSDGEIQVSEALNFTDNLTVVSSNITDATGIEAFKNITYLNLYNNKLDSIDLSQNTKLETLFLKQNQLLKLDLSHNPKIKILNLTGNRVVMDSLDLSGVTDLEEFNITNSSRNIKFLKHLNITQNTKLKKLNFSFAIAFTMSTLDLTGCTNLEYLKLDRCEMRSLDLSKNTKLTRLEIGGNKFYTSGLDVSVNTLLEYIDVSYSGLSSFDVSTNNNLTYLRLWKNSLASANLANGNNAFMATDLTQNDGCCFQVDDKQYCDTTWFKDLTSRFSEDCSICLNEDLTWENDTLFSRETDATFQWVQCDDSVTILTGDTNSYLVPQKNGSYACIVAHSDCTDTTDCMTINLTASLNPIELKKIKVYPNPVSNILTYVSWSNSSAGIRIVTPSGKVVMDQVKLGNQLKVSNLEKGIYILIVSDGKQVQYARFIKQ
ncbi:MAG: hypothetical protein COA58_11585 [Bacteroidetes bacterium]|nr:MAG: hypothetical protein COA58_11585 [Bacteroidota bacterium]